MSELLDVWKTYTSSVRNVLGVVGIVSKGETPGSVFPYTVVDTDQLNTSCIVRKSKF